MQQAALVLVLLQVPLTQGLSSEPCLSSSQGGVSIRRSSKSAAHRIVAAAVRVAAAVCISPVRVLWHVKDVVLLL
jgi:hypothetical protein